MLFFVMLSLSVFVAQAQDIEIRSLIINRTQTRIGQEFHRLFASLWVPVKGIDNYNIVVLEKASARWGSLIGILINDRVVFRQILGIRQNNLEEIAEKAVSIAHNYLFFHFLTQNKSSEDLAGSGF